jgi:hypothetical protein
MAAAQDAGLREIWVHPWRIAHGASLRIAGEPPSTSSALRSPSLVERGLRTRNGTGRELWSGSVAHAACVWDIAAAPGADVEATWLADCSTAGEAGPALRVTRTEGGVRISRADGASMELLLARGDTLDCSGERIVARGRGTLRIVMVAGADAADLARTRDRIVRRGLAAITGERAQHARLVADFGVAIESPEADEVAAFEWAKVGADGLLVELPGGARRLAAAYHDPGSADWNGSGPVVWASGRALASLGAALLAAGLREPVRDVLRSERPPPLAAAAHSWMGAASGVLGPDQTFESDADDGVPSDAQALWTPILREIGGRWGARPAAGAALELTPSLDGHRASMGVRRLRVGDSVVDAEVRRRFDRVNVRLQRRHGPPLPVSLELAGRAPLAVSADDEPLPGRRAVVPVSDRHEVLFQF